MAKQYYEVNKPTSEMTTRQLRKFISDKATEAQARLDSAPENPTRAFKEASHWITDKSGTHVRRDTSRMTKAEMREYADLLKNFNYTDFESKYAKESEWKKNRKKYETFVQNMWSEGSKADQEYWGQYKTPTGKVSKKGFDDYMDFIQTLVSARSFIEQFGYENIEQWNRQAKTEQEKEMLRELLKTTYDNSKGLTKTELIKAFKKEYTASLKDMRQGKTTGSAKKPSKPKSTKGKQKSTNTIKTGKPRKMRESGKVHRTSS